MTTTAETLRAAMALIENEGRWCTGMMACTTDGVTCHHNDPAATSWCGLGALLAKRAPWEGQNLLQDAAYDLYQAGASHVNDDLGHAAILACYREAIRRAEEENRDG